MKTFGMRLISATSAERVENVTSFVGEDESGSFGILAGHARMLTFLKFGLAKFRQSRGEVEYLAIPGGLLYFANDEMRVVTRRYSRSQNYDELLAILDQQLLAEEESLRSVKDSLRRLDESILKRLLSLKSIGEV